MSTDDTATADTTEKIRPEDIKAKLVDIQNEATSTVEDTKTQLIAVGAGVGLVVLVIVFLLGRRAGMAKTTIIEVRRT